jgi:hypothetical protein
MLLSVLLWHNKVTMMSKTGLVMVSDGG